MSATSDEKAAGFCSFQSNPLSSDQASGAQTPLGTKQNEAPSNKDTKTGTTDNNNTSTMSSGVEDAAPGGSSNPEEFCKRGSRFLENSERNFVLPPVTSDPSVSHPLDVLSAREQRECDSASLNRICHEINKTYAMDNYHQTGKSESVDDEVKCCHQKEDDVVKVDEINERRKESAQDAQSKHECVESISETLQETRLINTENIDPRSDDTKTETVLRSEDLQQEKKSGCQKVNERIKATVDLEVVGCQTSEAPQEYDRTSVCDNVLTKRLTWSLSDTQTSGGICSQSQSTEGKSGCEVPVNDKNIGQCSTKNETKEQDFSGIGSSVGCILSSPEENVDVSNVEETRDSAKTNEFINNQEICCSVNIQSTLDYLSAIVSEEEKRESSSTDKLLLAAHQIVEIEQENLADETKCVSGPGTMDITHASNTSKYSGIVEEEGQTPKSVDSTQKHGTTPSHPDSGTVPDKRSNTRKRPQTQMFSKGAIGASSFPVDSRDDGFRRVHSTSAPGSRNSSPGRTPQGDSSLAALPRSGPPVFSGVKKRQDDEVNDDVFYCAETPDAETNFSAAPSTDDSRYHQSSTGVMRSDESVTTECNVDVVQNICSATEQSSESKETSDIRIKSQNLTSDADRTADQSPVQMRRQTTLERPQPCAEGPRLSSSSSGGQQRTPSENPRNSFPGILSLPQKLQQHLERQMVQPSKRHTIADQPCSSQTLPLPTGNASRAVSSDPELSTSAGSNPSSRSVQFARSKFPPSTLPKPKRPVSESFGVRPDQPPPGRAKRHSTYERRLDHETHANHPSITIARPQPKAPEPSVVAGTKHPSGETKDPRRNVIDSIMTSEQQRKTNDDDVDNQPQTISDDVTRSVGDVTRADRKSSSPKHVPHLTFRPFVDVSTASATLQLRFSQPRPHSMCSPISEEHHGLLQGEPEASTLAAGAAANRPPLMAQSPGGVRPQSSLGVPSSVGGGANRHVRSKSLSVNVQRKRSQIEEDCDKKTA